MPDFKLNTEEAIILHDILEECLSDLRMEIADTHDIKFKDNLKKKELLIKKILPELIVFSAQEPVI
jgi:hypothetical protein